MELARLGVSNTISRMQYIEKLARIEKHSGRPMRKKSGTVVNRTTLSLFLCGCRKTCGCNCDDTFFQYVGISETY